MEIDKLKKLYPVCDLDSIPDTLYRYRELNYQSLKSLLNGEVYLASLNGFNDPFESVKKFPDLEFSNFLRKEMEKSGVLCLCEKPDSHAMWSYYAGALTGFVVGYSSDDFLESLSPDLFKYIYKIKYVDQGSKFDEINLLGLISGVNDKIKYEKQKIFAVKNNDFSHECEFRLVIEPDGEKSAVGLYCFDRKSIGVVIFGEFMPSNDRITIRNALAGLNVRYKVAVRSTDSFGIDLVDD